MSCIVPATALMKYGAAYDTIFDEIETGDRVNINDTYKVNKLKWQMNQDGNWTKFTSAGISFDRFGDVDISLKEVGTKNIRPIYNGGNNQDWTVKSVNSNGIAKEVCSQIAEEMELQR